MPVDPMSGVVHDPLAARSQRRCEPAPSTRNFEQLFREFAPYVLRVLPRLGVRPADLDDVAQNVFMVVHGALPSFEGRSSAKTWIYGICIRVASNYRTRAHRRYEQLAADTLEAEDPQTPHAQLETKRALARLDRAIEKLSETQRAVFVLHDIEQLSVLEIAEALGCSKFTAYTRLYSARRSVRAEFAETSPVEVTRD